MAPGGAWDGLMCAEHGWAWWLDPISERLIPPPQISCCTVGFFGDGLVGHTS